MPLPAALAARLAKRGLLKETAVERPVEPAQIDDAEEIIAEDYDDDHTGRTNVDGEGGKQEDMSEALIYETVACPNKSNRYHECVAFCKERWGLKPFRHNPELEKKHDRLLRRYPLDEEIVEVGDPETGRYYYWNIQTDEVSWLPPTHPRAKVSLPAERLRELTNKTDIPLPESTQSKRRRRKNSAEDSNSESSGAENDDDLNEDKDFEQLEKEVLRRKRQSEADRGITKKKKKDANLDPMDPAAYSDIPKGKWTAGLEGRGSANTGADVTASGPLFQQRPYPNPGAILRMNKE